MIRWKGGVGTVIKNVKKQLEEKGHEVDIISREDDLQIYSFRKSVNLIRQLVKKKNENYNYDIIYTHDWSMTFPLLFPTRLFKEKHYCQFHGVQFGKVSSWFQSYVGKEMYNKLIVNREDQLERFPKSSLIFNGLDRDLFKQLKIKRIENSVGFANDPVKMYHFDEIKEAVMTSGKIFMPIWGINHEKMPDFYNQIETFISFPLEKIAGFNMSWLEAMSCGVPKIVGNDAGIGGMLPIDKIKDFSSIREAIEKATEKDYPTLIPDGFSWNDHVNKLLELWEK